MRDLAAVIFDCDGVLFDSRQANIKFYNHILAHFGLPLMTEEDESFVHMQTADESVRKIFRSTPFTQEAQQYRKSLDYTPFIHDMVMEPGLNELLKELRSRFGLAVATNRSHTIGEVLRRHGLEKFFDIVVSSLDVRHPKPHPESLFKILDFFGIEPFRSVYVGDSKVDYETAKAAEISFISFRNDRLDALFHANCMEDIWRIIEGKY